jgi:hypothetical protein
LKLSDRLRRLDRIFGAFYDRSVAKTTAGQQFERAAQFRQRRSVRIGVLIAGTVLWLVLLVVAVISIFAGSPRAGITLGLAALACLLGLAGSAVVQRRQGRL